MTMFPGLGLLPHLALRLLLAVCLLVPAVSAQAKKASKPERVQDLAYGTALYELFQQNHFAALTELLVAQQRDAMPNHQQHAQLVQAGIHLAYGMDREAERLYLAVIAEHPNDEDRARAWFYLAKLRYQKGLDGLAIEALQAVDHHLSVDLHSEYIYLYDKIALGALAEGQPLQEDAARLDQLKRFEMATGQQSIYRFYIDYNRAVAGLDISAADDTAVRKAARSLERLHGKLNATTVQDNSDELLLLRDRVLMSLGFVHLRLQEPGRAERAFAKIRQQSEIIGPALVGFGWAALQDGDFERALTPWLTLQQRPIAESSTSEALLAVPYIYENLEQPHSALAAYQLAVDRIDAERQALDVISADVKARGFAAVMQPERLPRGYRVDDDAQIYSREQLRGSHWLDNEVEFVSPLSLVTPELAVHMRELLASKSMRMRFAQFLDVLWLQNNLRSWQQKLQTFEFAIRERQQHSEQFAARYSAQALSASVEALELRYQQALANWEQAADPDQRWRLMTPAERALQQRINTAGKTLAGIERRLQGLDEQSGKLAPTDRQTLAGQHKRLQIMQGLLDWQVAWQYPERRWEYQKGLANISDLLASSQDARQQLPAQLAAQRSQTAMLARVGDNVMVVEQQFEQLAWLRAQLEADLAQTIVQALEVREHRMTRYLAQARLAKARVLERIAAQGQVIPVADSESLSDDEQPRERKL